MRVTESNLYKNCIAHKTIGLGDLYFFENYVIAEFKEGINLCFANFSDAALLINQFYGKNNFGFINNRIHSHSVLLADAHLFNKSFKNLKACASVVYSIFGDRSFELEKHFFSFKKKKFTDLNSANYWVIKKLRKHGNYVIK